MKVLTPAHKAGSKTLLVTKFFFTQTEKSSMTEIALMSKLLVPRCQNRSEIETKNRSKSSREAGFGATEMWETPSSPPTLTLRDPLPPTEHPTKQWPLFPTEEFWFKFELQFKRGLNHLKKSWFKRVSCPCSPVHLGTLRISDNDILGVSWSVIHGNNSSKFDLQMVNKKQ